MIQRLKIEANLANKYIHWLLATVLQIKNGKNNQEQINTHWKSPNYCE